MNLKQPTFPAMLRAFSFITLARWYYLGVATMSLVVFSCQESPVSVEPPDPDAPFVEYRSWTAPQPIEAAPEVYGPFGPLPSSLSTSNTDDLHLLIGIPADSLFPHERLRLGYLFWDGMQWTLKAEIESDGWFIPSTSIAIAPNRTHLFWGGITPDRQQDWLNRSVFSSDLFHCFWNGATCSTPTSISTIGPHDRSVRFAEAMQDQQGRIHLIVNLEGPSYHLILDAQGQLLSKTLLGLQAHPRILIQGDTLHFVYMDAPQGRGGDNDLYYQTYHDGVWSTPVVTFHDVGKSGHHPTLAIDAEGVYHLAFYAHDPSGPVTTMYTHSEDAGRTWAVPEALFTNRNFFFRAPQLAIDGYGIVHLTWNHVGGALSNPNMTGFDSYYASRREGQWSEVQRLFSEYEPTSEAHLAVDGNDVVHVVFQALDKNIYHARFE